MPDAPQIVIAGGGLAGLSLALALKQALGDGIGVTMCDPALARDPAGDGRAYAIAAAARRMFGALGIWSQVGAEAQPILGMVVTDSRLDDPVRPAFLTFEGDVAPGEPFAHMVEGRHLTTLLVERCRQAGVSLKPASVEGFAAAPERIAVRIAGEEPAEAALLVAADGARSRLREEAGIGWIHWPYRQSGIVATLSHERPHEGRAYEHFLPSGPFATLPLPPGGSLGHRSSIVWTEREEAVPALLAGSPDSVLGEIERRFGLALGRLALDSAPKAYPLSFGVARRFSAPRLCLLGDAAHVIHPIAGQGLNLGLHDAAALAEIVVDAVRLGLDPGGPAIGAAYERARRFDITAMGAVTDALNRLFSNGSTPLRLARDLGLGLVDRMPGLKRIFIGRAAGLRGEGAPRLLKGEAL